jgi:hypothetical protein
MSIYDINFNTQTDNLENPLRRKPKFAAWMHTLMKPLQWLHNLFYIEYVNGSYNLYNKYDSLTAYTVGDRVYGEDRGLYECIQLGTGNPTTDTNYWVKILDNFIGLEERRKYTSQIITFEYMLNRWFFNNPADPQIYIRNNNIISNIFLMAPSDPYSSKMSVNDYFATTYMCVDPSYPSTYNFTIYVPAALFATLGNNLNNRESAIRAYADKFVLAGIRYNIDTF